MRPEIVVSKLTENMASPAFSSFPPPALPTLIFQAMTFS
jgi:hypothetical protein